MDEPKEFAVNAYWIEDTTYPGPELANNICSACGRTGGTWRKGIPATNKFSFCPWCGKKMHAGSNLEDELIDAIASENITNIEDFLGYPVSAEVLENLEDRIRDILTQMPKEEIQKYEQKYFFQMRHPETNLEE